jgi:phenylalanine-4-hydroxylase
MRPVKLRAAAAPTGGAPGDADPRAFELPPGHPGVDDPDYRARRAEIAAAGAAYRAGERIPEVRYSPEEDEVWRLVSSELASKHERHACGEYLLAGERLALPRSRVPQLAEVDEQLRALTGFGLHPVAGLVPAREFYASLAQRTFRSTPYIRHHSVPFYTPEPDIVHEIIGHARMLASPAFADLYEAAGGASRRAEMDEAHDFFSRVFWFTMEFGLVRESGELKAYGAGLLSSYGEIEIFHKAEVRPFDVPAMGTTAYDVTRYQPVLYVAESLPRLLDDLGEFFESYDDDAYARMAAAAAGGGAAAAFAS